MSCMKPRTLKAGQSTMTAPGNCSFSSCSICSRVCRARMTPVRVTASMVMAFEAIVRRYASLSKRGTSWFSVPSMVSTLLRVIVAAAAAFSVSCAAWRKRLSAPLMPSKPVPFLTFTLSESLNPLEVSSMLRGWGNKCPRCPEAVAAHEKSAKATRAASV